MSDLRYRMFFFRATPCCHGPNHQGTNSHAVGIWADPFDQCSHPGGLAWAIKGGNNGFSAVQILKKWPWPLAMLKASGPMNFAGPLKGYLIASLRHRSSLRHRPAHLFGIAHQDLSREGPPIAPHPDVDLEKAATCSAVLPTDRHENALCVTSSTGYESPTFTMGQLQEGWQVLVISESFSTLVLKTCGPINTTRDTSNCSPNRRIRAMHDLSSPIVVLSIPDPPIP
jgi:hypothetical protein